MRKGRETDCSALAPYSHRCVAETLIGLNRGMFLMQYSMVSAISRMEGLGGKIQVPRATYSFRMSFCTVPRRDSGEAPCFFPTRTYMARMMAAVELIVKEVLILSRGIPSKSRSISSSVSTATPSFPTSYRARGSSESIPSWVGRSKARLNPVCPLLSRNLNRSLVSSAVAIPAYGRMVQSWLRYIVG